MREAGDRINECNQDFTPVNRGQRGILLAMFEATRLLHLVPLLLIANIISAQPEFSADLVDLQKRDSPVLARLYLGKDKRRIDMQSAGGDDTIYLRLVEPTAVKRGSHITVGGSGNAIIIDFASKTSTVLWPEQKKYVQRSLKQLVPSELYALYAFVQAADVDNACAEWMRRPGAAGESCKNMGSETVNGRATVKYELSCYSEICRLWIDRSLQVLVKRETKWNNTELRNIQASPQPGSLFEIPVGYESKTLGGFIRPTYPQ